MDVETLRTLERMARATASDAALPAEITDAAAVLRDHIAEVFAGAGVAVAAHPREPQTAAGGSGMQGGESPAAPIAPGLSIKPGPDGFEVKPKTPDAAAAAATVQTILDLAAGKQLGPVSAALLRIVLIVSEMESDE